MWLIFIPLRVIGRVEVLGHLVFKRSIEVDKENLALNFEKWNCMVKGGVLLWHLACEVSIEVDKEKV